ncbi:outer membrane protein assembly factor BamD [Arcobacter porcinus]|uniref:Beta-barrel assembly machinery complex, BamD/YfiO lipoprotein n=1 Tax=Arcobacter porcinus TaxID=1935204 RepID=A0A1C0AUH1_9BACT|nr:outer membrane protein assembly factor BamD [Arcobacter porcinus]OCL89671.1 Outer membrane protein assembly factor BamD [Aliarcobacter thereius]OCL81850.1 Outer membrane protein assembly factor BamD [Arcobacter porcinus]OCL83968.1 Outer membrane protein assembly factor BamD [Arcobacter porcinus]OCL87159.1 Outer membrane protein assembly factor BamD [Arcobacter porcinus]OCL89753.1 Outer membrane protein assembly factor BamD [Arcobacter porcinus]
MIRANNIKNILTIFILIFILNACSSKTEEYNKPALYWYNKMLKQISMAELEEADDTFISLESEHRNSPLIPSAILILVEAHMQNEEYVLANFYLDEYIKRFALSKDVDYIRYLKIKSNFKGFKRQNRDQVLIDDTLIQIDDFEKRHSFSKYMPLVQTIKTRLMISKSLMDKDISELYKRRDKPEAQEYYLEKSKESWKYMDEIEKPYVPVIRRIFE